MNKKSGSPYGVSFLIRLGVLLAFLLVVGGGLAYDRLVLVPNGQEAVERVMKVCSDPMARKAAVQEAAGRAPTSTESSGEYQIDNWTFGRILPNLEGHKVSVVYSGDTVSEVYRGGISDEERALYK